MRLPAQDHPAHPGHPALSGPKLLAFRAAAVVAMWVAVWVVAGFRDLNPDPLKLLLVVAVIGATAWLLVDSIVAQPPGWRMDRPDPHDWIGHDPRTAFHVQQVESHLEGRERGRVLREHLLDLAGEVSGARHGGGPEAPISDPDLVALLTRRDQLTIAEIDDAVSRMERL